MEVSLQKGWCKKVDAKFDIQQILALKPKYDWDFSGREPVLILHNHKEINAEVKRTNLISQEISSDKSYW